MLKKISTYHSLKNWLLILLTAAIYFFSARLGLLLAFENSNSTPIWPPSGLALAATILLGKRVWPGIMLGAFVVNVFVFLSNNAASVPVVIGVSAIISIGNTLEALAGYYLLKGISNNSSNVKKKKTI